VVCLTDFAADFDGISKISASFLFNVDNLDFDLLN